MKVLIIGNRSHQFIYNYVKTLKKVYLNSDLEIDILSQDSSDLFFPSDKFYNNIYALIVPSFFQKNRFLKVLYQHILFRKYIKRLDFYELAQITFEKPDMETFKGLKFAYNAAERGGNIPTAMNAANELAVSRFLDEKIKYLDIYDIIEYAMENIKYIDNPTVEQILETEKTVYEMIESRW